MADDMDIPADGLGAYAEVTLDPDQGGIPTTEDVCPELSNDDQADLDEDGQTHLVHLVLRTADGRYISGAGEHPFLFDVLDQSADVTVNEPQDLDESATQTAIEAGRTGILSADGEGEAHLSFGWGEHSIAITIEVEKTHE